MELKNNSLFYNKIKRLRFSKWIGMGLPWTLKESRPGLDLEEEIEDDRISIMGCQKMKIHNWMIFEQEV